MKWLIALSLSLNALLMWGVVWLAGQALGVAAAPGASFTEGVSEPNPAESTVYRRATSIHALTPVEAGDIVFAGDSQIAVCSWAELLGATVVRNRGIDGDGVFGLAARLGMVLEGPPAQIYILTGGNDLWAEMPLGVVMAEYQRLLHAIRLEAPETKVVLLSTPPMARSHISHGVENERAQRLNEAVRALALEHEAVYVDFTEAMTHWDGTLNRKYTYDGGHLNGLGCATAARAVSPYVEAALETRE